ncbi:hypothetical protein U9M48_008289 [Paspalum notatum var. saurae]|uniref:Uncharacterized protein n=1 Tax=Paspalum notatum var. saurae TaxID=547442 RepID=A0AAQ3SPG8_PASNO
MQVAARSAAAAASTDLAVRHGVGVFPRTTLGVSPRPRQVRVRLHRDRDLRSLLIARAPAAAHCSHLFVRALGAAVLQHQSRCVERSSAAFGPQRRFLSAPHSLGPQRPAHCMNDQVKKHVIVSVQATSSAKDTSDDDRRLLYIMMGLCIAEKLYSKFPVFKNNEMLCKYIALATVVFSLIKAAYQSFKLAKEICQLIKYYQVQLKSGAPKSKGN